LPTARPSGTSIRVMNASVRTPDAVPIVTSDRASARASLGRCMKAPRPHLTSRTSALLPSATFLLMTEDAMSGRLSTVPVTSRRAYSALSAGAIVSVWLIRRPRSASNVEKYK